MCLCSYGVIFLTLTLSYLCEIYKPSAVGNGSHLAQ